MEVDREANTLNGLRDINHKIEMEQKIHRALVYEIRA